MATAAIAIQNLRKTFGKEGFVALDKISFSIPQGSLFGLLGPNGAGKTTLISILSGTLAPGSGEVTVGGFSLPRQIHELHRKIGIVPQEIALYQSLTPLENLKYFGRLMKLSSSEIQTRSDYFLKQFGLYEVRNKPVQKFSGGMKRRLNLIAGLMNEPEILFLDEPTEGIDVQSRNAILTFLKKLNQEKGTTIIYTSHLLSEVEGLCEELLIMDQGKVKLQGSWAQIKEQTGNASTLEEAFLALTGTEYRDQS
ncbi:ABC transporter ATP-binding protein [bacterium SCSIO 12741]|nr:ABC transporter ATP-binding protein [bacterium SCSIO 12741]